MGDEKREKLKDLYYKIKDCKKCSLYKTKNKFVFGGGNANAELVFVGEAPGKNEDLKGKPFVGRAGKVLDDLLGSINLTRDQVFIANVLKCRPPGNRDPRAEEVEACKGHLFNQLKIMEPKIICTLGKHSTQLILNTKQGITGLRGKVYRRGNKIIFPINHPAAVLYNPSKYGTLQKDFKRIEELLEENIEKEAVNLGEEKKEESRQLGLF